jgi:hypothetical protein
MLLRIAGRRSGGDTCGKDQQQAKLVGDVFGSATARFHGEFSEAISG